MMEEVRQMFKKLQTDINDTKDSLKDMETNITKNINNNINETVGNLQLKIEHLEQITEYQEMRLDSLERTQRQRNVVLFGVMEEERGYGDLTHKILKILNENMGVQCTLLEIQALRRIGRKGAKTRPVILTLTTLGRKIEILKKWKNLQNTDYTIAEDYPPKILEKRKALYEQAKVEKDKGNKVLIKYDRLVILPPNRTETNPQSSRNNKRALSQTPPQALPTNKNKEVKGAKQVQKKNKISSYWTATRHTSSNTQMVHSDQSEVEEDDRNAVQLQQKQ